MHTPLVVSGATVLRAGEREQALVSSVDLFATIAQLAGSPIGAWQDSLSFAPLLAGAGAGPRQEGYTEYSGSDRSSLHGLGHSRRALQTDRLRLRRAAPLRSGAGSH